jgi:hypothetical protein
MVTGVSDMRMMLEIRKLTTAIKKLDVPGTQNSPLRIPQLVH